MPADAAAAASAGVRRALAHRVREHTADANRGECNAIAYPHLSNLLSLN
jgi:hypothetical protein